MLAGGQKFVLVIGDEGGVLVHLVKGRVREALFCPVPGEDGAGPEALRSYLDRHRRVPVHVLLDVHEQMYREDTLPRANPLDKRKIVTRRMDLAFPETQLKATLPIRDGEPGEIMILGVPEVEPLTTWLPFLESLRNPVSGLSLLPLESHGMLAPLAGAAAKSSLDLSRLLDLRRKPKATNGRPRQWRIFVSQQATGGFRQIIERDGRMLVTRMTLRPIEETPPTEVAVLIEREFRSTITYIKRMGYTDGTPIDLVVLSAAEVREALEALDIPARLTVMTPQEAARRLNLPKVGPSDSPFADVLHAVWFARKSKPVLVMRTPAMRRDMLIHQADRVAPLAAAAATLAAGLFVGEMGQKFLDTTDLIQTRQNQLASARRELAELEGQFEGLPAPFPDMKAIIEVRRKLDENALKLAPMLRKLAASLGGEATIINMRLQPDQRQQSPSRRGRPSRASRQSDEGLPPHRLELEVALRDTGHQPERATGAAMAVKRRLAEQFPGYAVEATNLPVNITHDKNLTGRLDRQYGIADVVPTASFVLRWEGES